jgi:hypothetical protein
MATTQPTDVINFAPSTQQTLDMLPLFQSVQQYYETSFQHLAWIVGITITFAGVIVPLAITYYQRRVLRLDKEELRREIKAEIVAAERKLSNDFSKAISELSNDADKTRQEVWREIKIVTGQISIVQGNVMRVNFPIVAIEYYIHATDILLGAEDLVDCQQALTLIAGCIVQKGPLEEWNFGRTEMDKVNKLLGRVEGRQ